MTTLRVAFSRMDESGNQLQPLVLEAVFADGRATGHNEYVTGYEISTEHGPIVRQSFRMHDDSNRLHTCCRRDSSEIDVVEW